MTIWQIYVCMKDTARRASPSVHFRNPFGSCNCMMKTFSMAVALHSQLALVLAVVATLAYAQGRYCPASMIQLYNGVVCQNDQTCQMQSSGFFCYRGYCCANSVSKYFEMNRVPCIVDLSDFIP